MSLSHHILCVFFSSNKSHHPNPTAASEKLKLDVSHLFGLINASS